MNVPNEYVEGGEPPSQFQDVESPLTDLDAADI